MNIKRDARGRAGIPNTPEGRAETDLAFRNLSSKSILVDIISYDPPSLSNLNNSVTYIIVDGRNQPGGWFEKYPFLVGS